jgi:hypothetical protein
LSKKAHEFKGIQVNFDICSGKLPEENVIALFDLQGNLGSTMQRGV